MTVRAIYRSVAMAEAEPPHDRIALKIHYPAAPTGSAEELNTGLIACDRTRIPCPIVIIMPGINVGPESYAWLARHLAHSGMIAVTYQFIAEEMPGYISLTPGLRLDRLGPDGFGRGPSATAISPIMDELAELNASEGPLRGSFSLDQIVIGGHSAGGTVALLNANSDWFPGVRGAFSYGAHTGAAMALGHPPDTILPIKETCPVLLMGGTSDGVIESSGQRYGMPGVDATERLVASFDRGVEPGLGQNHLVLLREANHFTFAHPRDDSTGRAFLDHDELRPPGEYRDVMAKLITAFVAGSLHGNNTEFEQALADSAPLVALHKAK